MVVLFVTKASFKRSLEDMGELNVTNTRRDLKKNKKIKKIFK